MSLGNGTRSVPPSHIEFVVESLCEWACLANGRLLRHILEKNRFIAATGRMILLTGKFYVVIYFIPDVPLFFLQDRGSVVVKVIDCGWRVMSPSLVSLKTCRVGVD
ncbi:hypothetical protein TNCV_2403651 [Trichonephila clavipes]|uniref:Uncharacterized protein n=1 Tax=Trichonephila clavipes TaxID=2585209 RepID=A0A8X6UY17_TRICX|nr:hypothetical protein TNCV_2403651 [Trichonephila clavipes]